MRELLSVTGYAGYEVRKERFEGSEYGVPDGESFEVESAFTLSGDYIGSPEMAKHLVGKYGIQPELRNKDSQTCTIGFSPEDNKWYGWSHRGICAFGIGDMLFDAEFADDDTPYAQHGSIRIETMEQARQAAVNFAEYVN